MNAPRESLIQDLVADLRPVHGPGRTGRVLALWLALAGLYTATITFATGPIRAGAFGNLVEFPWFGAETLVAAALIAALAHAALRSAIPGEANPARHLALPFVLFGLWIAVYVVGLWAPAHPASMLGKRDHCVWQTMLFGIPSLALLLWFARGMMPLWPRTTALLAGAASAAIPGAMMQFACMYSPGHNLTHHLPPIVLAAAFGAAIGRFALVRRQVVPRRRDASMH